MRRFESRSDGSTVHRFALWCGSFFSRKETREGKSVQKLNLECSVFERVRCITNDRIWLGSAYPFAFTI
jgi:hypothetical protein